MKKKLWNSKAIMLMMMFLFSCSPKPKASRAPTFSVETQGKSIAACIKMKEEEYNWEYDEIIAYCAEQWRGYITFIEENKDA